MRYDCAIKLVNLAIENQILAVTEEHLVLVYRKGTPTFPEGWYAETKEYLAYELTDDKTGQKALFDALKEKRRKNHENIKKNGCEN